MKINYKKMCKSNNSGITLIALVIIITIVLIIAGITIGAITGENGLIKKAVEGKDSSDIAHEKDVLEQAIVNARSKSRYGDVEKDLLETELDSSKEIESIEEDTDGIVVAFKSGRAYVVGTSGSVKSISVMPTVTTPPTTAVDKNTQYKDANEDIAVIPKGFRVSSHKDSNNEYDEQTIETGLVVLDGNDNEWVWIPVPDASVMYTHVDEGIAITGGAGKTYISGVTTNYYSNTILSGKTRGLPNVTSSNWREPDVVVGSDGTSYDNATSTVDSTKKNYEIAGYNSLQAMAQGLVDDYEEMIKSVEDNKGFYVGRYELTGTVANPTEVSGPTLTNQDWYYLYKACKSINTGTTGVETRMIWGCQWDVMCKFVEDENHSIADSKSWGNYSNSTGKAAIYGKNGSKQNTGFSEYWSAKNIYDIAGNCLEWSQDVWKTDYRTARGGNYGNNGTYDPVSCCIHFYPTNGRSHYSSRPQLYIK